MSMVRVEDPSPYVAINAAWQMRGDVDLVLDAAENADVLGVVEARTGDNRPIDVAQILHLGGLRRAAEGFPAWQVGQDTSSGAASGSALAVRAGSPVKLRRVTTWLASRAGHWHSSVQTRWMKVGVLDDHGTRTRAIVVHFPTPSSGQQPEARRALRRAVRRAQRAGVRWIVLGDFNCDVAELARWLGARGCYRRDVMGVVWGHTAATAARGKGWGRMVGTHRQHPASDHAVLTVTETHRSTVRDPRVSEVP